MTGKLVGWLDVKGQPLPMPRPRLNRYGGVGVPKAIREYKKLVASEATRRFTGFLRKGRLPLKGRVGLWLDFYRATQVRADLDNLIKTVQDALLGIIYQDDHQIVELHARKRYGCSNPRVEIAVYDTVLEGE